MKNAHQTTVNPVTNETENLKIFERLLSEFKTIKFPEVKNPTYLEILKLNRREAAWSNLLIFFFNPNKEHQLKDLFIKSFFEALDEKIEIGNFNQIEVRGEVSTYDYKRIDIIIEGQTFVAGIENKIDFYCENPLDAYGKKIDDLAKNKEPHKESFKIILSLNHCVERAGFKNLKYEHFLSQLQQNLINYRSGANPIYLTFLEDFLQNINSTLKYKDMKENNEALQFFKNNAEDIEKLYSKYNEFKRSAKQWFDMIYEEIDLSKCDNRFKELYGQNAKVYKDGIYDGKYPSFNIYLETPRQVIDFEIQTAGDFGIFGYVKDQNFIDLEINSYDEEPTKEIIGFVEQIIDGISL